MLERHEKRIFNSIWYHEESQILKTILRNNKTEGFKLPDFKMCHEMTTLKTVNIGMKLDI